MKKYAMPVIMLAVFETVAIVLWLMKDNPFYLFNFSYIGISISLGVFLFIKKYKHARRIVQLLVGLYMLVYLGLICNENMQIEGFWYYLFTGVFEAATIHYAVAKIFGPLIFGRGWCGYACWTAMVLDFLPYKVPKQPRKATGVDQVYHICCRTDLCCCVVPCTRWEHGEDHVLGVCHWQHSVLCDRDHPCICVPGQPGVLQIHLSDYSIPEADELLLAVPREMRQGKMHILWQVQTGLPDECGYYG